MLKFATVAMLLPVVLASVNMARSAAFKHQQDTQQYEDLYYLPSQDWLLIGSAGYREAGASFVWLRSLVYFGEQVIQRGSSAHLREYAQAIISLDPQFNRVYRWAASVMLYTAESPTAEDVYMSIELLELARAQFPEDGEIAWQLGSTYAFELTSALKVEAEKQKAETKGRELFLIASRLGGGPVWAGLNAVQGLQKLGKTEQVKRHLMEVYESTDDEFARDQIEMRLQRLTDQAFILALRATVTEFEKQRKNNFSYTDGGLFYLIGKRSFASSKMSLLSYFNPLGFVLPQKTGSAAP